MDNNTEEAGTEFIDVKVLNRDNIVTTYTIRKNTPLGKLMKIHYLRAEFNALNLRFLYDGKRIKLNDTAQSLEIEDSDIIEVHITDV